MRPMHRRQFLHSLAALPAAFMLDGAQPRPRGKVAVAGAGLAGLAAAYELDRAGYEVAILEARSRREGASTP
jgi:monoamine oxidase